MIKFDVRYITTHWDQLCALDSESRVPQRKQ